MKILGKTYQKMHTKFIKNVTFMQENTFVYINMSGKFTHRNT